jgi:hypothetical protein
MGESSISPKLFFQNTPGKTYELIEEDQTWSENRNIFD